MNKIYLILLASIFFIGCSEDDTLSAESKILSYNIVIDKQEFTGAINQSTKTINITTNSVELPNSLTPEIKISDNATITPSLTTPQNFNQEQDIEYTVTAENGEKTVYTVLVTNSDNQITFFSITPDETTFEGIIDETSKTITLETTGLELGSSIIVPEIEYSSTAVITPDPSTPQDFSENVNYTLIAENGEQVTYTVITNNTPLSDEKKILSFEILMDGGTLEGIIDHETLTILVETDKRPNNNAANIEVSPGASISPDPSNLQNFLLNEDVEYTVTAANNTSNVYTIKLKRTAFYNLTGTGQNGQIETKYYSTANPFLYTSNMDFSLPNTRMLLENDTNSYELDFTLNDSFTTDDGYLRNEYQIEFPANIITATDYVLKYEVDGQIEAESQYEIDILAENAPTITSYNQTSYYYNDTLIITGTNLFPGVRIAAHNYTIYQYNDSHVDVNAEGTELSLLLYYNKAMFPGYVNLPSPHPTPIALYKDGRFGGTIIVDFE